MPNGICAVTMPSRSFPKTGFDMKGKNILKMIVLTAFATAFVSGLSIEALAKPKVEKAPFGKTADGRAVEIYTLTNTDGSTAQIMTYGGTVVSLKVPDKSGKLGDVVLGYDSVGDYEKHTSFFGSLIGRYANRIGRGKYSLGGREYTLAKNNGENHLHGGVKGYDRVVWNARAFTNVGGTISNSNI